eukprot:scaffold152297_cov30-Tisochrysis_lutea.AAC.1
MASLALAECEGSGEMGEGRGDSEKGRRRRLPHLMAVRTKISPPESASERADERRSRQEYKEEYER